MADEKKIKDQQTALSKDAHDKIQRLATIVLETVDDVKFKDELKEFGDAESKDKVTAKLSIQEKRIVADINADHMRLKKIMKEMQNTSYSLQEGYKQVEELKALAKTFDTMHKGIDSLPKEGMFENLKHGLKVIGEALALILSVLSLRFIREYESPGKDAGFKDKLKATGKAIKAGAHSFFEADEVKALKEMARELERVEKKMSDLDAKISARDEPSSISMFPE